MKKLLVLSISLLTLISCSEDKVDLAKYTKKGKEIAQNTQKLLGKNLKGTMKAKGPVAAVSFCNTKALPLTTEMEQKYHASIKRVSDKLRNEKNEGNAKEKTVIEQFKTSLSKGETVTPITQMGKDGKVHFYAPIKVGAVCLTCHGTTLAKPVDSILKLTYPNDKAIGYKEGELRGIWSITMDKEN